MQPDRLWRLQLCCRLLLARRYSSRSIHDLRGTLVDRCNKFKKPAVVPSLVPDATDSTENVRNIGIVAHIDAGKTTTTERMLYLSGLTRYMGNVDSGDTVTDYMAQERERGITITSAAIVFDWTNYKINLIDTPGHVDFTLEVERSLRVLDGAVTILDASKGVEAQTLKVWSQAKKFGVPSIIYLNKVDKPNASVRNSLKSIEEKLKVTPILLNLPISEGKSFRGLYDLVTLQKLIWQSPNKDCKSFDCLPIDKGTEILSISRYRENMIGLLAEYDSDLAESILNCDNLDQISSSILERAIRRSVVGIYDEVSDLNMDQKIVPVLCGSSAMTIGVQSLLWAIGKYLPSPCEKRRHFVKFYPENSLCALAFKIVSHPFLGLLTLVRIYKGRLTAGSKIYNVNRDCQESVLNVYWPMGDEMRECGSRGIPAGHIAAVTGLIVTITGDTLTADRRTAQEAKRSYQNYSTGRQTDMSNDICLSSGDELILAGIDAPDPVFFCSIEPSSLMEQKKFDEALTRLTREDPSIRISIDPESQQTILRGMGELQIEIIRDRLKTEYGLDVFMGSVHINYKERPKHDSSYEDSYELNDSLNQKSNSVRLSLRVNTSPNIGNLTSIAIHHVKDERYGFLANIPDYMKEAIKDGCINACYKGPVLGYPIQDIKVTLCGLSVVGNVNTSLINACANCCLSKILSSMHCELLEPVMTLNITAPETYAQSLVVDLAHRRANIDKSEWCEIDKTRRIHCTAPMSELFGFSTAVRTLTSGTGEVHMHFSNYEPASDHHVQKLRQKVM